MTTEAVRSIGVAGAGFMGSGIAESAARAGVRVTFLEPQERALARSRERIDQSVARAVRGGKLAPQAGGQLVERIEWTTDLADLAESDARDRGDRRGSDVKRELFARPRRGGPGRAHPRLEHLVDPDRRARRRDHAPAARAAACTSSPRPGDEPGRDRRRARHQPGDDRRAPMRSPQQLGKHADPHQGPRRLHRQHAARPLPDGGRADVRGRLRHPRGHRRRNETGLRAPDGAADAVRLHRPRRPAGRLRLALRRVQASPNTRPRRCSSGWSPPAASAARAGAASTTTRRLRRGWPHEHARRDGRLRPHPGAARLPRDDPPDRARADRAARGGDRREVRVPAGRPASCSPSTTSSPCRSRRSTAAPAPAR